MASSEADTQAFRNWFEYKNKFLQIFGTQYGKTRDTIRNDRVTIRNDRVTIRKERDTIRNDRGTIRRDRDTIKNDRDTIRNDRKSISKPDFSSPWTNFEL